MSEVPKSHFLDKRAGALIEEGVGNPDDLISTRELAQWLGYSEQWVEIARTRGFGPVFVRLAPRCIRYRRSDVRAWLEARVQTHASAYASEWKSPTGRKRGSKVINGKVVTATEAGPRRPTPRLSTLMPEPAK